MIQLVVARYLENLNWVGNIPPQIQAVVYDKSGENLPDSVALPNVGREAHTYLHHICENFENLADFLVFCQGKPFDHAFDFHRTLREWAVNPPQNDFSWLGHIIDTDTHDGARLFATWSKNLGHERLQMNAFHRALFGFDGPEEYSFVLGAQFGVSRDLITARGLEFWRRALQISLDFPDAAHCFERSWDRVFGVVGVAPELLGEKKTLYLKPIRRLKSSEYERQLRYCCLVRITELTLILRTFSRAHLLNSPRPL